MSIRFDKLIYWGSISEILSDIDSDFDISFTYRMLDSEFGVVYPVSPPPSEIIMEDDDPNTALDGVTFLGLVHNIYFSYLPESSDDDFETDLYPELLDNEETKLQLQNWIDDNNPYWEQYTDKDIKAMELIEKYNKNVLLLRSTRKVDASVSGSISQSGQSQSVDLTPIVQQLSNINNKLQTTEQIDNSQKSITDVLNQQANTIQVDDIGLLRNKKGYY